MKKKFLQFGDIALIVLLACVPLFSSFPYRINIFLSWEGAYRMSEGQIPFKDFGTPLGGMYWVIPAFFFKIFGPYMVSLVKAQTFINIISGLAFRSVLKSMDVHPGVRFSSVLLYCLSFSFFNFWPWYNHTVIVYEFIGMAFLFMALFREKLQISRRYLFIVLAAIFTLCSFLTKQDGGGMAFGISLVLLAFYGFQEKKWMPLMLYTASFVLCFGALAIGLGEGFGYWFNHGQPPHTARISILDISNDFFGGSAWIKFYIFLIGLFLLLRFRRFSEFWQNKKLVFFTLFTLGIMAEAAVFQVTSYIPNDNNIFFHSFAVAYLLTIVPVPEWYNRNSGKVVLVCSVGILLWWSGVYWKYFQRVLVRALPSESVSENRSGEQENVVNKSTYKINHDTLDIPFEEWVYSPRPSFKNIYMPRPTMEGIEAILNMDVVRNTANIKVLNMSELTPLAKEMPFELEKNPKLPLWYHLGVGMFNEQAEIYENRIREDYYDLIIFEHIPNLNNFYPFRIRNVLQEYYQLENAFAAPRRGDTQGTIEVYIRKR